MTDYFALLNEPRRPWLDSDRLKARFVELSAEAHPDRVHHRPQAEREAANRRYAEFNAAYTCLRHPKRRLAHLLELERGVRPAEVQKIPSAMIELFMQVSQACREADAFLSERGRTPSPLLKAQSFETGIQLTEKLRSLLEGLDARLSQHTIQLKNLNMAWESAPAAGSPNRIHLLPCSRIEQIYHELSYLTRWTDQIHERIDRVST